MAHFRDKSSVGTVNGDELLWLLDDPNGTPADTKVTVDTLLGRTFSLAGFSEAVQDIIGAMVAAAGGSYNDGANTITFPAGATGDFAPVEHTHTASDITDFNTAADARVTAAMQALDPPNVVASGATYALLPADIGKVHVLNGSGAGFSATLANTGNGYSFKVINRSGADYTLPAIAGVTNEYPLDAAHTKLANKGAATCFIYTAGGTTYARYEGDTL